MSEDNGTGDKYAGIPHLGTVFVDGSDRNADWIKTRGLDVSLDTEEKFAAWMRSDRITPEHLRRMPIFSDYNRRAYPWLDRLAGVTTGP